MLTTHMASVERLLAAQSKVPASSGHGVNKGTPREPFIREFLQSHLPTIASIGAGEIIDSNSLPNQTRNQFDIVLYKNNHPKLDFGGGVHCFLIESVVATIEVKSKLTKSDLEQAILAAHRAKSMQPSTTTSFNAGFVPPRVLSYVVAYNGPQKMSTVTKWIADVHHRNGIPRVTRPAQEEQRIATPSSTIDGVFILNKGFTYFDNVPLGLNTTNVGSINTNLGWWSADTETGSLLFLFLLLQSAFANVQGQWLNPIPYLKDFSVPSVLWSPG